ncbi:hypothetical protein [Lactobacillus terrae]|nr:hypothetical protein [Lactobacillus terrae]
MIIEYDEEDIPTEEDKIHRIDGLFYKNVFWPFVVSFFTTAGILFLAK